MGLLNAAASTSGEGVCEPIPEKSRGRFLNVVFLKRNPWNGSRAAPPPAPSLVSTLSSCPYHSLTSLPVWLTLEYSVSPPTIRCQMSVW